MNPVPVFIDGYFGVPRLISRTPREYPFADNGDVTTAMYQGTYEIDQAYFKPTPRGTEDPLNPGFYLADETKPDVAQGDIGQFVRTYTNVPLRQIEYGSLFIPKPDIPGNFPQVFGNLLVFRPISTLASYDAYSIVAISSDSGAPPLLSYPTGGTYTVTIGGQTTGAIAFNASAATLQTALNALTSVIARGSVTVTGSYNSPDGFKIVFAPYSAPAIDATALTCSAGGPTSTATALDANKGQLQFTANPVTPGATLTGGTFTITVFGQTTAVIAYNASIATVQAAINALANVNGSATVTVPAGYTQPLSSDLKNIWFYVALALPAVATNSAALTAAGSTATITQNLTYGWTLTFSGGAIVTRTIISTTPHGITNADAIFVTQAGGYVNLASGTFSVINGTTIVFTATAGTVFTAAGAITQVGRRTITGYSPTTSQTRVKYVSDFYLPGVTAGITTPDDIPQPVFQGDPTSILTAIFSGATSVNYQVGDLGKWKGAIYQRKVTVFDPSKI